MNSEWPKIRYRDFHDIPRAVVVEWCGVLYLLDCQFDEDIDDFEPTYAVYQVPVELREA